MQVSTRSSPTDQRIADTVRVAPYLPHVIRPHGQLTLMPPQDNSTSSRKPKREKRPPRQERQPRTHDEPYFNVGAPRTPRRGQPGSPGARTRTTRRPDVSDAGSIPDYPPPSFDEAIAAAAAARDASAPPLSPADSTTTHSSSSPDRYQPVPILIPPLPRSQNQPVVTRIQPDAELSDSVRYSTQAEYDSGSDDGDLEVISASEATSPVTPLEPDSPRHPARGGMQLELPPSSARTVRSSRSQLTLTPHSSETSQDSGDQSGSSPSAESQAGDLPRNLTPSPVPPKRRLHLLSGLLKSRDNHFSSAPSTPTHAAASQLSLPLHILSLPGSPSKPHRGESLIARKLFGNKGKDRAIDPEAERPSEPLETWEMLSDVEREVPASSTDAAIPLMSPDPRRKSARSKHRSLLNPRVVPPPLPLSQTPQRHPDAEPRESPAPQRNLTASAFSGAAPSSPPERSPIQLMQSPSRGRSLRATSSMIWTPRRPVPSPTHSATTPSSPSTTSLLSSVTVTHVDHDAEPPTTTTVVHEDQEDTFGALPPSPVQEEEEEQFVTPPGSPVRSLSALPLATIGSRHSSPVRHEGRPGVTLRDDGPVPLPLGSPTRSEPHARAVRSPTITPRPSVGALHSFAPSNPSPLSNQSSSFERQASILPAASSTIENGTAPKRDTVVSIGDTESLIELYVHSTGEPDRRTTPANDLDPEQQPQQHHHYPGRPLPHPPGSAQSVPVRPVMLDLFLAGAGNGRDVSRATAAGSLPPYAEVEQQNASGGGSVLLSSQKKKQQQQQSSKQSLFQFSRSRPRPICSIPPSPYQQGYAPPSIPTVLDDDAYASSEPSSPGSTYEMSSPLPSPTAMQREFTSFEALDDDGDGDGDDYDYDDDYDLHGLGGGGNMIVNVNRENTLLARRTIITNNSRVRAQPPPSPSSPTTPTLTTTMTMTEGDGGNDGAHPRQAQAQLGRIQVVRRRVTRNGRVKLKLVLNGATVDRCAICAMQFRDRESAALGCGGSGGGGDGGSGGGSGSGGVPCQHAFHERCAAGSSHRGRNNACPVCGTTTPF